MAERENELARLQRRLCDVSAELDEFKRNDGLRNNDIARLTADLQVITRENQFIKDELKKTADQRDPLQTSMDQATGNTHHM